MRYGYMIALVDDGGPYSLYESEGFEFDTIEAAVEDAKTLFDQVDEAEVVQVFRSPGGSTDDLVAGWGPTDGLRLVEAK